MNGEAHKPSPDAAPSPLPAQPLSYFGAEPQDDTRLLTRIVKIVAAGAIVLGTCHLGRFTIQLPRTDLLAFRWTSFRIAWHRNLELAADWGYLLTGIALVLFGIGCLRLRRAARTRLIVTAALVPLIAFLANAADLWTALIRGVSTGTGGRPNDWEQLTAVAASLVAALRSCLFPALAIGILNRAPVTRLFCSDASQSS